MSNKRSRVSVIKEYFQMSSADAMTEFKALTDADKTELAQGAAQNLGLTQDDVAFPLPA